MLYHLSYIPSLGLFSKCTFSEYLLCLNCVLPKIHKLKSQAPELQNVALERVTADVVSYAGPLIQYDWCTYKNRRSGDRHAHRVNAI